MRPPGLSLKAAPSDNSAWAPRDRRSWVPVCEVLLRANEKYTNTHIYTHSLLDLPCLGLPGSLPHSVRPTAQAWGGLSAHLSVGGSSWLQSQALLQTLSVHLNAEGELPGWLALCNLILLLPLLQGVSSVPNPTAGPRLAFPGSQAGGRAPPCNLTPPFLTLPMGKLVRLCSAPAQPQAPD